jgi:cytochrome b
VNTTSISRADSGGTGVVAPTILVWDAPVRIFHWLMVICFAGAYLSADSERWRLLHVALGYTMVGLVGFRVLWGLIGTRYARFASFVRGPAAVLGYLRTLRRGAPEHYTGHNPAGAVAIVLLLGSTLLISLSGWAVFNEIGGDWLAGAHESVANLMLGVIGIHLLGVLVSSRLHHENLIGAMITGRKTGRSEDAMRGGARPVLAVALLLAVLAFWWQQWQAAPPAGDLAPAVQAAASRPTSASH